MNDNDDDLLKLLLPDEPVVEETIDLVQTHFKDDHWLSQLKDFEFGSID